MKTNNNISNINQSSLLDKIILAPPYPKSLLPKGSPKAGIVTRNRNPFNVLGNSPFTLFKSEIYREFPSIDHAENEASDEKQNTNKQDVFIRLQQKMAFFFKWSNDNRMLNGAIENQQLNTSIVNLASGHLRKHRGSSGYLFEVTCKPEKASGVSEFEKEANRLLFRGTSHEQKSSVFSETDILQPLKGPKERVFRNLAGESGHLIKSAKHTGFFIRDRQGKQPDFHASQFRNNRTVLEPERTMQNFRGSEPGLMMFGRNIGGISSVLSKPFLDLSHVRTETKGLQTVTGRYKAVPVSILQLFDSRPSLFTKLNSQKSFPGDIEHADLPSAENNDSQKNKREIKARAGNLSELFSLGIYQFLKTNEAAEYFNSAIPDLPDRFPAERDLTNKDNPVDRGRIPGTRPLKALPIKKYSIQHQNTDELISLKTAQASLNLPSVFFEELSLADQSRVLQLARNNPRNNSTIKTGLLEKLRLKKSSSLFSALEQVKRDKTDRATLLEPSSRQNAIAQRARLKMQEILELQESIQQSRESNELQSTALLQKLYEQLLLDHQYGRSDTKTLIQAIQGLGTQLERTTKPEPRIPARPFKPLHFLGPV